MPTLEQINRVEEGRARIAEYMYALAVLETSYYSCFLPPDSVTLEFVITAPGIAPIDPRLIKCIIDRVGKTVDDLVRDVGLVRNHKGASPANINEWLDVFAQHEGN